MFNIIVEIYQSIFITKNNHYHRFNGTDTIIGINVFRNNQEYIVIFNETSIENASFTSMKYLYQYISYNIKDDILIGINLNYENILSNILFVIGLFNYV